MAKEQLRKHVGIALNDEEIATLKRLVNDTMMNASEIIRQLIKKADSDKTTKTMIMSNYLYENSAKMDPKRREEVQLRIMSIRTTQKKENALVNKGGSVSLSNQENDSAYDRVNQSSEFWGMSEEDLIRIAKAPWANGEDEKHA